MQNCIVKGCGRGLASKAEIARKVCRHCVPTNKPFKITSRGQVMESLFKNDEIHQQPGQTNAFAPRRTNYGND